MNFFLLFLLVALCATLSIVHATNDELSLQNEASGRGLQEIGADAKKRGKKKHKKEPILCSLKNKGGWLNYCSGVQSSYMPSFAKKLHWDKECLDDETKDPSKSSSKKLDDVINSVKKEPRNLRADGVKGETTQQNKQKMLADDIRKKGTDNTPVKLKDVTGSIGSILAPKSMEPPKSNSPASKGMTMVEEIELVVLPVEKLCRQSPIDMRSTGFVIPLAKENPILQLNYDTFKGDLDESDKGVKYKAGKDGPRIAVYNGREYSLLQMHLHAPSEHKLEGKEYAAEAHFVHKAINPPADEYLVLGVFIEKADPTATDTSAMPVSELYPLDQAITRSATVDKSLASLDFSKFFEYPGSLTTAPFSADVTWAMLANPIMSKTLAGELLAAETAGSGDIAKEGIGGKGALGPVRGIKTTVYGAEVLTFTQGNK